MVATLPLTRAFPGGAVDGEMPFEHFAAVAAAAFHGFADRAQNEFRVGGVEFLPALP